MKQGIFDLKSKMKNKRLWIISCIWAFLLSVFIVFGHVLSKQESLWKLQIRSLMNFAILFVFFTVLIAFVFILLEYLSERKTNKPVSGANPKDMKKSFLLSYFGILLCYIPSFLGLYPGLFTYDATGQLEMVQLHAVTTHHPVIHTFLLGGLANAALKLFGGVNKGVMIYSVIQMLIMAYCFAYVLNYAKKIGIPGWLRILFLFWFGFFPPNVVLVFSCTKDSLFSAFMVLFAVKSIELLTEGEAFLNSRKKMISWVLAAFLTVIFRNNALYAMILFVPVLFFTIRKGKKNFLIYAGILALLVFLYQVPFCKAVTVRGVSTNEFLSVPCQQMVRVYKQKGSELSAEERLFIEESFTDVAFEYYHPKMADATKGTLQLDKTQNSKEQFIKTYLKLAKRYPQIYTDAFLLNNMDYWYPSGDMVLDIWGNKGYLSIESRLPAIQNPVIPFIWNYYRRFTDTSLVMGDTPGAVLFSPALQFYIFFFVMGYLLYQRRGKELAAFVFVWLIWLTFLLGPVVLVRYSIYLYYLLPLEVALVLKKKGNEE